MADSCRLVFAQQCFVCSHSAAGARGRYGFPREGFMQFIRMSRRRGRKAKSIADLVATGSAFPRGSNTHERALEAHCPGAENPGRNQGPELHRLPCALARTACRIASEQRWENI